MTVTFCNRSQLTFLAMIPFFIGLLVVFPVLGFATWHLYKRIHAIEHRLADFPKSRPGQDIEVGVVIDRFSKRLVLAQHQREIRSRGILLIPKDMRPIFARKVIYHKDRALKKLARLSDPRPAQSGQAVAGSEGKENRMTLDPEAKALAAQAFRLLTRLNIAKDGSVVAV